MNTVVQSGLLSLTKERFQFIHVPFLATLDTCARHRRPVVPSPLTGFWGGRGGKKSSLYACGRKNKVQKRSCLINSTVMCSGLGQTVESLRKHLLSARDTHFSHQSSVNLGLFTSSPRFTEEESQAYSGPLTWPRSGSRCHRAEIPTLPNTRHPFPLGTSLTPRVWS